MPFPEGLEARPPQGPQRSTARRRFAADLAQPGHDVESRALRLAIEDLVETFGPRYPDGPEYLKRLDALERVDV